MEKFEASVALSESNSDIEPPPALEQDSTTMPEAIESSLPDAIENTTMPGDLESSIDLPVELPPPLETSSFESDLAFLQSL